MNNSHLMAIAEGTMRGKLPTEIKEIVLSGLLTPKAIAKGTIVRVARNAWMTGIKVGLQGVVVSQES